MRVGTTRPPTPNANPQRKEAMSHLPTCRTRKELTGNVWVYYSDPDRNCTDQSHVDAYTEETQ